MVKMDNTVLLLDDNFHDNSNRNDNTNNTQYIKYKTWTQNNSYRNFAKNFVVITNVSFWKLKRNGTDLLKHCLLYSV